MLPAGTILEVLYNVTDRTDGSVYDKKILLGIDNFSTNAVNIVNKKEVLLDILPIIIICSSVNDFGL